MNLLHGDCLDVLRTLPDNSVDSLVTDPPYFLTNEGGSGFMGKQWDSLSPANAIAESLFRSARLDLGTVEERPAAASANTVRTQAHAQPSNLAAQCAANSFSARQLRSNRSTSSVQEIAITKAEALALCKEWLPSLTIAVESLPGHARFVASPTSIGVGNRNTARIVAATLLDEPKWLESVTTFIATDLTQAAKSSSEATNGTGSEKKFIEEMDGHVNAAESIASEATSSAIISSPSEYRGTISRIISLPFVRAAISECTKSPSFIPILSEVFHRRWAREAFRVLKPGAYGLVFGGTRVYHRLTSAMEDEGYEVRDVIQWLYGSGFPKSHNIEKAGAGEQWAGWGTALKPAWEPVVLVRKPCSEKTVAANVLKHGTGALNIDASRIEAGVDHAANCNRTNVSGAWGQTKGAAVTASPLGRFPANLVLSHSPYCTDTCDIECPVLALDKQSGTLKSGGKAGKTYETEADSIFGIATKRGGQCTADSGGASRFFYVAKISSSERNAGLDGFDRKEGLERHLRTMSDPRMDRPQVRNLNQNNHPTVKPKKLMMYLIRLITPPGGVVLDPFCGSGSTGVAAKEGGFDFIGIEKESEYHAIASARIEAAKAHA